MAEPEHDQSNAIRFDEPSDVARRADEAPYARALGLRILEARKGHARAALRLGPEHTNFMSAPHGAAIFSVLDHALSVAVNTLGRPAVLLVCGVNYLSAPKLGDEVTSDVEVLHAGRTTVVARMEARGGDGKLLASGQATCVFVGGKG